MMADGAEYFHYNIRDLRTVPERQPGFDSILPRGQPFGPTIVEDEVGLNSRSYAIKHVCMSSCLFNYSFSQGKASQEVA